MSCWPRCWSCCRWLGRREAWGSLRPPPRCGWCGWKAVHDALVMWLVLRRQTTDEAMGMLVLRFPVVASLEVKGCGYAEKVLDRRGMRAVTCLPALTSLDLRCCSQVTAAGVQAQHHRRPSSLHIEF
jgi:hypothetical protein